MSEAPYILITADTHAGGSHAQYREYLDPAWREAFDEWRGGYRNPALEHYGRKKLRYWDPEVRAQDQNSQGVVGEVVFPNTVPPFFAKSIVTAQPPRPEHYERALAGIRIMGDMKSVAFKDEVWPKFLRDNARKVLKLDR